MTTYATSDTLKLEQVKQSSFFKHLYMRPVHAQVIGPGLDHKDSGDS